MLENTIRRGKFGADLLAKAGEVVRLRKDLEDMRDRHRKMLDRIGAQAQLRTEERERQISLLQARVDELTEAAFHTQQSAPPVSTPDTQDVYLPIVGLSDAQYTALRKASQSAGVSYRASSTSHTVYIKAHDLEALQKAVQIIDISARTREPLLERLLDAYYDRKNILYADTPQDGGGLWDV